MRAKLPIRDYQYLMDTIGSTHVDDSAQSFTVVRKPSRRITPPTHNLPLLQPQPASSGSASGQPPPPLDDTVHYPPLSPASPRREAISKTERDDNPPRVHSTRGKTIRKVTPSTHNLPFPQPQPASSGSASGQPHPPLDDTVHYPPLSPASPRREAISKTERDDNPPRVHNTRGKTVRKEPQPGIPPRDVHPQPAASRKRRLQIKQEPDNAPSAQNFGIWDTPLDTPQAQDAYVDANFPVNPSPYTHTTRGSPSPAKRLFQSNQGPRLFGHKRKVRRIPEYAPLRTPAVIPDQVQQMETRSGQLRDSGTLKPQETKPKRAKYVPLFNLHGISYTFGFP